MAYLMQDLVHYQYKYRKQIVLFIKLMLTICTQLNEALVPVFQRRSSIQLCTDVQTEP